MRFCINLTNNAVTQGLYDGPSQADGWVTKDGTSENIQIQFHNDTVPALLPAGTPILFGCKALDQFNAATYDTSTMAFTAPADPTVGYYTAALATNTEPINIALGSTDGGQTAGNTPSIPTTTCEIQWWLNGLGNLPTKSQTFSVEIDNTPNRGNETEPGTTTPYPPPAPLAALVANVSALTAIANLYTAGFFLFAPLGPDFRASRNAQFAAAIL